MRTTLIVASLWLIAACGKSDPSSPTGNSATSADSGAAVGAPAPPGEASADNSPRGLVKNGGFEETSEDMPVAGWFTQKGASNDAEGATKGSTYAVVNSTDEQRGRVLSLSGDAGTSTWWMVSQTLPVRVEQPQVVLTFMQRGVGLKREGKQFENANMVVEFMGRSNRRLTIARNMPIRGDVPWTAGRLVVNGPAGAKKVRVSAFSSMSGTFEVDDIDVTIRDLRPWNAAQNRTLFELLGDEVLASYPFVDAQARHGFITHSSKLVDTAAAAKDRDTFVATLQKLLAPFQDPHVVIKVDQAVLPTAPPEELPKLWNFDALKARIDKPLFSKRNFSAFRLKGGVGMLVIGSWLQQGFPTKAFQQAIDALNDAPGIIIDVRANQGGAENLAMQIAGRFTDKPVTYAKHRFRLGDGYGSWFERVLKPFGATYKGKVVVLQSKWSMSSNEGFLAMARALPNVTTVGVTSRGATSNPQPIQLTSDIAVVTSRWQAALPDGTLIEHKGIAPEVEVNAPPTAYAKADPMLERALTILGGGGGEASPVHETD